MQIDHVTFRTGDIAGTKQFLEMVFDLEEGPRPAVIQQRVAGHWLYSEGRPIVHIIGTHGTATQTPDRSTEFIDHVGFARTDYDAFRARLDRLNIPYSPMDIPELDERRLFLRLPSGPLMEVVFRTPASG